MSRFRISYSLDIFAYFSDSLSVAYGGLYYNCNEIFSYYLKTRKCCKMMIYIIHIYIYVYVNRCINNGAWALIQIVNEMKQNQYRFCKSRTLVHRFSSLLESEIETKKFKLLTLMNFLTDHKKNQVFFFCNTNN